MLFTRADEAEAQWAVVEPILDAWESADAPEFPNYAAGGTGPEAAARLMARRGYVWRELV